MGYTSFESIKNFCINGPRISEILHKNSAINNNHVFMQNMTDFRFVYLYYEKNKQKELKIKNYQYDNF